MTGFFISKKQKKLMKERRRKIKLVEKGLALNDLDPEPNHGTVSKRPRNVEMSAQSVDKSPMVITVPADLSSKESKKFRKDARRKARNDGKDDSLIRFVVEGEVPVEPKRKKAKAQSFPCINDLVRQQNVKVEEDIKQSSEDLLTDEYKDRYVALDCEMVGIGSEGRQSALARVSMTNWSGDTLIDTFVKVPTKVTDFRTFVSGVKPKHIANESAMDEKLCRETVAKILKEKVLVGHALKNDLHALMLTHPAPDIRDTAKYRPFNRLANNKKWRPRKLRDLVKEHCNMTIQVEGESHDSVDDAKATMELFKTVHAQWEKEIELKLSKKSK